MEAINHLFIYGSKPLYTSINIFVLDSLLPDINHAAPVFKKITLLTYNTNIIKFTLLKYTFQWFLEYSVTHHHHHLNPEYFHHSKKKPISSHFPSPFSLALATTNQLFTSMDLPLFQTFLVSRIIQYVAFCDFCDLLRRMFFGLIHAIACISSSSLLVAE